MEPFVFFSSLPLRVRLGSTCLLLVLILIVLLLILRVLWKREILEQAIENGLQRENMEETVVEGFQCFTENETENQPDSEDSKAQWRFEETSTSSDSCRDRQVVKLKSMTLMEEEPWTFEETSTSSDLWWDRRVVKLKSKTLMEEEPYAAAIDNFDLPYTCSNCFDWNFPTRNRIQLHCCEHCKVIFYCSTNCQKEDWEDHKAECEYFRCNRFSIPCVEVRVAARILRKSMAQPEWKAFNGRSYDSLMDHWYKQCNDYDFIKTVKTEFVEIQKLMGQDAPHFITFFKTRCKVVVNAFAIIVYTPRQESRGTALYVGLSVHNHSCRPDAFVVSDGSKLLLRTTKKKMYSDKLTISYRPNVYLDRDKRREILLKQYYFNCRCKECEDKYERDKEESGRPTCCPNGWFSLKKLRCSICRGDINTGYREARKANEKLKTVFYDFLRSTFVILDFYYSDTVMSMIENFESYRKLLSDENLYLRLLTSEIYRCSKGDIKFEFAQIYYSMMSEQPYTFEFLYFIYDWGMNLRDAEMFLPLEAVEMAIDMGEVLCGEYHYLTRFLKRKMPQLSKSYAT